MLSQLTRLPRIAKLAIVVGNDALLSVVAVWTALILRVGGVPKIAMQHVLFGSILALLLTPAVGFAFGIYRSVLRFASPGLMVRIALVSTTSAAVFGMLALIGRAPLSRATTFSAVFALVLFALQLMSRQFARWLMDARSTQQKRVAIYGAGAAGRQLAKLLRDTRDFAPVLFLDDDASLVGRAVEDLVVVSPQDRKLAARLQSSRVHEILLAIPSLKAGRRREILERLAQLPYRVRIVPGLAELVQGDSAAIKNMRDVSIEDLLGRETVAPLAGLLEKCVKGKNVLITGGGGSIGAELCRQVLALSPARLIVLEHSEFALYQIEHELGSANAGLGGKVQLDFVLGSVGDAARLAELFGRARVDTVYHAAAYKHVPIVEGNPIEGFKNNVIGTWLLAQAAAQADVRHFILISSDKAVRPTNVMGATKRMAEIALQVFGERHPTTVFSMVRFGNVLESSGSVVPLFRRQIESGGPVTLTHPDVTRYFMTLQEAVQLVIQAGAMATGGEVFVLDMGQPVRIYDLARRMIRLSGRSVRDAENPAGEIAIQTIGLRPGEKLYEELLISGESVGTAHPRIWQVREHAVDASAFEQELQRVVNARDGIRASVDVREVLARWVTGYAPREPAEKPHAPLAGAGVREPAADPAVGVVNLRA